MFELQFNDAKVNKLYGYNTKEDRRRRQYDNNGKNGQTD